MLIRTRILLQGVGRSFQLVNQIWVEDIELVALDNLKAQPRLSSKAKDDVECATLLQQERRYNVASKRCFPCYATRQIMSTQRLCMILLTILSHSVVTTCRACFVCHDHDNDAAYHAAKLLDTPLVEGCHDHSASGCTCSIRILCGLC